MLICPDKQQNVLICPNKQQNVLICPDKQQNVLICPDKQQNNHQRHQNNWTETFLGLICPEKQQVNKITIRDISTTQTLYSNVFEETTTWSDQYFLMTALS